MCGDNQKVHKTWIPFPEFTSRKRTHNNLPAILEVSGLTRDFIPEHSVQLFLEPGARFSKVPKRFSEPESQTKSQALWFLSRFIHVFFKCT